MQLSKLSREGYFLLPQLSLWIGWGFVCTNGRGTAVQHYSWHSSGSCNWHSWWRGALPGPRPSAGPRVNPQNCSRDKARRGWMCDGQIQLASTSVLQCVYTRGGGVGGRCAQLALVGIAQFLQWMLMEPRPCANLWIYFDRPGGYFWHMWGRPFSKLAPAPSPCPHSLHLRVHMEGPTNSAPSQTIQLAGSGSGLPVPPSVCRSESASMQLI